MTPPNLARVERRLLTLEEAADYMSLPVATTRKLGIGRICLGGKIRYDRISIDEHLDAEQGRASTVANDETPEAALASWKKHRHAAGRP